MIRTVIVDDEPLAREGLRIRLAAEPDIQVVAEADDVINATRTIEALAPDLVFLDIQMPDGSGFDVLERVCTKHLPVVVFVTAYDAYAVRAFDVSATDYVLKPFTAERFRKALERARQHLKRDGGEEHAHNVADLLDRNADPDGEPRLKRFAVRHRSRYLLVNADDIDFIESAGNYARLHTANGSYLVRYTMQELERRLDPARFTRTHRGFIVKTSSVREIVPNAHGDFDVHLRNGATVRLSRTYRDRVLGDR